MGEICAIWLPQKNECFTENAQYIDETGIGEKSVNALKSKYGVKAEYVNNIANVTNGNWTYYTLASAPAFQQSCGSGQGGNDLLCLNRCSMANHEYIKLDVNMSFGVCQSAGTWKDGSLKFAKLSPTHTEKASSNAYVGMAVYPYWFFAAFYLTLVITY